MLVTFTAPAASFHSHTFSLIAYTATGANRVGGTSLTGVPSSHTTVRTVRYTAVPNLNT